MCALVCPSKAACTPGTLHSWAACWTCSIALQFKEASSSLHTWGIYRHDVCVCIHRNNINTHTDSWWWHGRERDTHAHTNSFVSASCLQFAPVARILTLSEAEWRESCWQLIGCVVSVFCVRCYEFQFFTHSAVSLVLKQVLNFSMNWFTLLENKKC